MYSGLAYLSLPSDSNMVLSTLSKNVIMISANYALDSLSPQPEFIGAEGYPLVIRDTERVTCEQQAASSEQ